jgi:hypothetical protein
VDFVLAVLVFPALVVGLALGAGLLVERAAGRSLPGLLLVPVGFAALVGVSQLSTWWGAIAPATPILLVLVALAGLVLGRTRLRSPGVDPWAVGAVVATYLLVAAPILFAGRVTFTGYLLDTTAAVQLTGADHLLHHGRDFLGLGDSSSRQELYQYFGRSYPSGAHTVLAGVGWLTGVDLAWLYSPYMAVLLALAALPLAFLARSAGLPRSLAAGAGVVAAAPALPYAYALQGSIKEVVLIPILGSLGALLVLWGREGAFEVRAAIPLGVVGAAGLSCIGLAFAPWLGLVALACGVVAVARVGARGRRRLARAAVGLAGVVLLFSLPTVAAFGSSLTIATNLSESNAAYANDPGNLLRPLSAAQAAGIWLGGSHRTGPTHLGTTYVLIGIALAGAALGALWLWRRGRTALLVWTAIQLVVWVVLTVRGTTWTDAKLLVLLSAAVVLLALLGAASFGRRVEGIALAAVVALGVLASDAIQAHDTNLAPTARFRELASIGARDWPGQGRILTPDFDEYTFWFLRRMEVDGPGFARKGYAAPLLDGTLPGYGKTYDLDALPGRTVVRYRLVVVRRGPDKSRPPAAFTRVWRGTFYEVWRRDPRVRVVAHFPLGVGIEPVDRPRCRDVANLALLARRTPGGRLASVARPPVVPVALPSLAAGGERLVVPSGARRRLGVRVPVAGSYVMWLQGAVSGPTEVRVDGRPIGTPRRQSGGDRSWIRVGSVDLDPGRHAVTLTRSGHDRTLGDGAATVFTGAALEPAATGDDTVARTDPSGWRSLCGRQLDWIEVVR